MPRPQLGLLILYWPKSGLISPLGADQASHKTGLDLFHAGARECRELVCHRAGPDGLPYRGCSIPLPSGTLRPRAACLSNLARCRVAAGLHAAQHECQSLHVGSAGVRVVRHELKPRRGHEIGTACHTPRRGGSDGPSCALHDIQQLQRCLTCDATTRWLLPVLCSCSSVGSAAAARAASPCSTDPIGGMGVPIHTMKRSMAVCR
jgi:hypothetical protein